MTDHSWKFKMCISSCLTTLYILKGFPELPWFSPSSKQMGEEVVCRKSPTSKSHLFVNKFIYWVTFYLWKWVTWPEGDRKKNLVPVYSATYLLVHYTIEGHSLESLSGILGDCQNTHGHFNKCD